MPKENTHIFFANELMRCPLRADLKRVLETHRETYLLGAIIPDTMYYGKHAVISDTLHGKSGNPTNSLIIDMLDQASDSRDVAFCCGYISHCALDIVFHPIVYYLSGNYYDPDPDKCDQAVYMHRHIETQLDIFINNRLRIHKILNYRLIKGLAFERIVARTCSVDVKKIRNTLNKQLRMNHLFTSRIAYKFFGLLRRTGIIQDWKIKGLFYADCDNGSGVDLTLLNYQDLLTGKERTTSVEELFKIATARACTMINQAYAYNRGEISRAELIQAIPGESLNTGTLHTPVNTIRYTKNR